MTEPHDKRKKLTYQDIALAVQMSDTGKTQEEIAAFFKVTQSTISRILRGFTDTRELAKRRLKGAAVQLTESAIRASRVAAVEGNGEVALELLDRIDVAPKRQQAAHEKGSARIMIVVGGVTPTAAL